MLTMPNLVLYTILNQELNSRSSSKPPAKDDFIILNKYYGKDIVKFNSQPFF
jgi:hypothetical protein